MQNCFSSQKILFKPRGSHCSEDLSDVERDPQFKLPLNGLDRGGCKDLKTRTGNNVKGLYVFSHPLILLS